MMVPAAAVKKAYALAQKRLHEQQRRNNNEDGESEDEHEDDIDNERELLLGDRQEKVRCRAVATLTSGVPCARCDCDARACEC